MKKYFSIIAVLALGLTACNKNEIQTPADEPVAKTYVYHFSIPASPPIPGGDFVFALEPLSLSKELDA